MIEMLHNTCFHAALPNNYVLNVSFHPGLLCNCLTEVLSTSLSVLLCKASLQLKSLLWFTQELYVITCCVTMQEGLHQAKGMEVCSWQAFLKDKKSCLLDSFRDTFRDSYRNGLQIYFAEFFEKGSPAPRKFELWMGKLSIDCHYVLLSTFLSEKDGLQRELVIKLHSEIAEISQQRFKFGIMSG